MYAMRKTSELWFPELSNNLYVLGNLYGWHNVGDILDYWYCQPITKREFFLRAQMSEWTASRGAVQDKAWHRLINIKLSFYQQFWNYYYHAWNAILSYINL